METLKDHWTVVLYCSPGDRKVGNYRKCLVVLGSRGRSPQVKVRQTVVWRSQSKIQSRIRLEGPYVEGA